MVVRSKAKASTTPVSAPTSQVAYLDQALLAVDAEKCRRSLKHFLRGAWGVLEPGVSFVDGWVVDAMVEHLEAMTLGQLHRMVINIQPRAIKSTLCSVAWEVWDWLQVPEDQFLCASYALNLSIRDNRRKRVLIESQWFQERFGNEFTLAGDQNVKSFFENDKRGYQLATSVGSATTGHGGSKLVIDDPHAADEAYSDADREAALRWFKETWSSRLNNQETGCMLVIGQRIHEMDVCGYILKDRPDWTHLNLPAYYEPARKCTTSIGWSDPRTVEGELLWPERFSKETLEGLRHDLGSNGFSAQYQQSPVPAGGGQFKEKWMRYFAREGDNYVLHTPEGDRHIPCASCWCFVVVDLAISSKQDADYTVIQTWAVTRERDILLIDQFRDHIDNPEQQKLIAATYRQHQPDFVEIETVAYQLALVQQLLKQGIPCKEYNPVKDKVSRASTAAILVEQGKVYFPRQAHYLDVLKDELLHFPFAAHDDMVDCVSMAAHIVSMPRPTGGFLMSPDLVFGDNETPREDELTETDKRYSAFL